MNTHNKFDALARSLCATPHPDDGIPTRKLKKESTQNRANDRKQRQLCAQAMRSLNLALSTQADDDLLASVFICAVEPGPASSCLLVTLCPTHPSAPFNPHATLARLAQIKAWLRSQIANDIHRKKVPQLTFQITPTPEPWS